jgi:glycosyltransferase involved in cell wall biosynthesis
LSEIHLSDVDAVISDSKQMAALVRDHVVQVVYPGVDVPDPWIRQQAIAPRPALIGAACRLAPEKGLVYLIRAFPEIRAWFPHVRLEIAGGGPEESALREESRLLGVSDAISFLGWQPDLEPFRARWDVFVSSSLNEGSPASVVEAMAAGLPVVATTAGDTPELVEHGRTGWICPMADPACLAQRVVELLSSEEMRLAMGHAGRRRAEQSFSIQRMVDSITAIYDQLISGPPSR